MTTQWVEHLCSCGTAFWADAHGRYCCNTCKAFSQRSVYTRQLIALVDGGMSQGQAASALGLSKSTVKSSLQRIRKRDDGSD